MNDRQLHVVLGTGPSGLAVADELLARGHRVRCVNRSGSATLPTGAALVTADVTDAARLREITEGAAAVYNCTHVPYAQQPETLPRIQDALLKAVGPSGAVLATVETLNLYGPTGGVPMTERTPFAATSHKGRVRARIAERYLEAHSRGDARVVLGMAADFFGPRTLTSSLGGGVFPPALSGDPVGAMGDIDLPHSYSYVPDIARALATLAEREDCWGRLWHLPVAPALTTRQVFDLIAEETGRPVRAEVLTEPRPWGPFDAAFMAEYAELFYWHTEPFVMDDTAVTEALGLRATPLPDALRATVQWYRDAFAAPTG
ncbi:NAD-dependent epimerase/dehydratase family protein [Streptomyces sp. NPDC050610]|uniref:NAD-dependent epimerase/dehydratase family protein n=1 Tax=Streptomyces sp. NPDC050610 TaxID=3157097 RepID=UPI00342D7894